MSVELTHSYRKKLRAIEPQFGANLRRAFNNAGLNLLYDEFAQPLKDVAYSSDDTYIKLSNVLLTSHPPEFRVKSFVIDLSNSCLHVSFDLGEMTFAAILSTTSPTMFPKLCTSTSTQINMYLHSMTADGRIGLHVVDDLFVARNSALKFRFAHGRIAELDGAVLVEAAQFQYDELSPFRLFVDEMTERLCRLLDVQLNKALKEYLLNEVIRHESQQELCDFKDYLVKRAASANATIDRLLATVRTHQYPIALRLPFTQHGKRYTLYGRGQLASVGGIVERRTDWHRDDRTLFGKLHLKRLKLMCDYHTTLMDAGDVRGHITVTAYECCFGVQFDEHSNVNVEIVALSDLEFDVTGLGALSWLNDDVRSLLVGHLRVETQSRVRRALERALQSASTSTVRV